uniref:BZIP domain-containing protein n=1 Tax=Cuerna arida TaxID=1464854 RepID=A0A1B6GJC5_9HEMI
MAPARLRNLKNNAVDPEIHKEKRERNNKAVRKTRAKKRIERERVPTDINNLTKENYFLAGQINVNLKNLDVYRDYLKSPDMEDLRQRLIELDRLIDDSKPILGRYKIPSVQPDFNIKKY